MASSRKGMHKLIILALLAFLFVIPNKPLAQSDESVEEVLNKYYEAVISQNFGIAAMYYDIPKLGENATNPNHRDIENVTSYFNYLYPIDNYILSAYKVLDVNKINEDTYSAKIQLNAVNTGTSDEMFYEQNVLLISSEDSEWKLTIEGYAKYIYEQSLAKPIEELNREEKVYRFYYEIEAGNYGVAANMISAKTSALESKDQSEVISYLKKNWEEKLIKSVKYFSAASLFILNEIEMEDKTLLLVSVEPFRNDIRLSNNSPTYILLQFDQVAGGEYINPTDGSQALNGTESTESLDMSFFENVLIIIVGIAVLVMLVAAAITFVSGSTSSSRQYSNRSQNYYRSERTTPSSNTPDISSSVDRLLEPSTNETAKPTTSKKSSSPNESDKNVPTGKRKLYLMDEPGSGEDSD